MFSDSSVEEGEYVVLLNLVIVLLLFISQDIKSYIHYHYHYHYHYIIYKISSCSSLLDLRILSTALASTFLKDSLAAGFNYENIGLIQFYFR